MRTANAALTALLNGTRKGIRLAQSSSQYISFPAGVQAQLASPLFAAECWVILDQLPVGAGGGYILSCARDTPAPIPGWQLNVNINTSNVQAIYGGFVGNSYSTLASNCPIVLGRPTHLCMTHDGTALKLYRDGALITQVGGTETLGPPGFNLFVGRLANASVYFFPGLIDEVRVYSRGLSAAEVAEHAQGIFRNESGLVVYLPCDEGSGTTAFDLSGKGNNGTLVAGPVYADFNPYPGSERQLRVADLVTITMINGTTLRYTSSDSDITSGGFLFDSKGPLFTRGKTKLTTGIAVDVMDLTVMPSPSHLINGMPFMQAVTLGFFDGAIVQVERAFMPAWGNVSTGTLIMFTGRVSDMESSRSRVEFKVKSDLELLNILMPRNIYQPGCVHTLYDNGCTAKKALFAVRSTVAGGSTTSSINSALTTVAAEFELGTIEFEAAVNLPGTVGNFVETPDSAALRIVGDIDIRMKVSCVDWTPALSFELLDKLVAGFVQFSYALRLNNTGTLSFYWSTDGATLSSQTSSIATNLADGFTKFIQATLKCNNGSGNSEVKFWLSDDNVTWTQLGTTQLGAVTSIFAGTAKVQLGGSRTGVAGVHQGKTYYAEIRNGIGGPIVAKFDPTIDTPQGGNILASTGELWTMNGTAALVGMTNRGVRRTVKAFSAGNFALIQPLPNTPVTGDLFAAYAGCDKLQSTCGTKIGITYTVDNTTDIFTATAHGLTNDLAVKLTTTGTFPTTVPALDAATPYFVINAAANTFKLARSPGGPAIDMSSNGTGVNKVAMKGKFANLDNFRGFPYVPIPETMI